jgi:hypothetical protein
MSTNSSAQVTKVPFSNQLTSMSGLLFTPLWAPLALSDIERTRP